MEMNHVFEEGRVTDAITVSKVGEKSVAHFSLAVNHRFKRNGETKEEVSFFNVVAWQRLADLAGQYLTKGRLTRVIGHLRQERWQDAAGQIRSKVVIVADRIDFLPQPTKADAAAATAPSGDDLPEEPELPQASDS